MHGENHRDRIETKKLLYIPSVNKLYAELTGAKVTWDTLVVIVIATLVVIVISTLVVIVIFVKLCRIVAFMDPISTLEVTILVASLLSIYATIIYAEM